MPNEPKHHYIPVFYLQQWTGDDQRLCEFSKPYDRVRPRRTHPDGTGYVRGLYRLPDAPPGEEYVVESKLMSDIDNWAAKTLQRLITDGPLPGTLDPRAAIGWCQFLYSLIVRNPEHLLLIKEKLKTLDPGEIAEHIRDDYSQMRGPNDPESFDDYKAGLASNPVDVPATRVLPVLLKSKRVIRMLASFKWRTATVLSAKYRLLTSDRPVIMTNGLVRPNAHIVLPISPRRLFIATKNEETFQAISSMPTDQLAKAVNNHVAQQAHKFVYGTDDRQLRYVANRLGKRVPSSPLG
jgi:hypothetical protein